jgi:hypothetical protein
LRLDGWDPLKRIGILRLIFERCASGSRRRFRIRWRVAQPTACRRTLAGERRGVSRGWLADGIPRSSRCPSYRRTPRATEDDLPKGYGESSSFGKSLTRARLMRRAPGLSSQSRSLLRTSGIKPPFTHWNVFVPNALWTAPSPCLCRAIRSRGTCGDGQGG